MHHILITEMAELFGYKNPALTIELDPTLASRPDELIRRAIGKDALAVRNATRVDADLICKLREFTPVRVVGRLGAGLDNIDVAAARQAGLEVVYTPDANTESVAEYVVGQILMATRRLSECHASTAGGRWDRLCFIGRQLSEITLGIVGFGRIGGRLAEILNPLCRRILVSTDIAENVRPPFVPMSLSDLFSSADVISLHLPLTSRTRGLIGSELLTRMRPQAILINTSRGEVICEPDLECFLRNRPDVTAVLDVRSKEPPGDQLFCDLPNACLSPHIAAFTSAAQEQVIISVLDDVGRVLSGGTPLWPAP